MSKVQLHAECVTWTPNSGCKRFDDSWVSGVTSTVGQRGIFMQQTLAGVRHVHLPFHCRRPPYAVGGVTLLRSPVAF